jgi:hypothetical protein
MATARIIPNLEQGTQCYVVEDAKGVKHLYVQGKALEECPPQLHADIMGWHPTANCVKWAFEYDGDEPPKLLYIRDGSDPGYHEYQWRQYIGARGHQRFP